MLKLSKKKIKCWEKQYAFYLHYCRFFASYSSALLAELIFMLYLLQVRTVKVTNVSLSATVQDIKEFFSFSGDIEHVEMQRFVKFAKFIQLYYFFSFHAPYRPLKTSILISLFTSLFFLAVVMSGLKLHMWLSKMHKVQRLHFFFRWVIEGLVGTIMISYFHCVLYYSIHSFVFNWTSNFFVVTCIYQALPFGVSDAIEEVT